MVKGELVRNGQIPDIFWNSVNGWDMAMAGKRSQGTNRLEAGKQTVIDNEDQHTYLTHRPKDEWRKGEKSPLACVAGDAVSQVRTRFQFEGGKSGIFEEKLDVRGI